jgi:hypothetical protein
MKNKNLLIGGAVVVGGLLFFYLRKKRAESLETPVDTGVTSTEKGMGLGTSGSGSGSGSEAGTSVSPTPPTGTTPPPTGTTPPPTGTSTQKLTPFEVNVRMLRTCGSKPLVGGPRKIQYQKCLDEQKAILRSQGLISFNGLSEDNVSRLDFDGNIID